MAQNESRECPFIESHLSDYIDGHLGSDDAARIEAHLSTCSRCANVLADLRALLEELPELPPLTPPPHLYTTVRQQAIREGLVRPRMRLLKWPMMAAAVAAAALLVLLVSPLVHIGPPPPADSVQAIIQDLHHAETLYMNATQRLDRLARQKIETLPPETRRTFEANLALIDQTITESREYVQTHQHSQKGWEYLLAAYQKKVEFLQLFVDSEAG